MFSLFLALGTVAMAQVYNVDPGLGTLDQAISDHGAGTYMLQAGKWYGLNSIVEINDNISIIGEETDSLPAIIQVGSATDGSIFPSMFRLFKDFTLKNVFISNQDFNGVEGGSVFDMQAPVRIVVDKCVIDPAGGNYTFAGGTPADHSKLFLTNSQVYRNGSMLGPNDGGWLQVMAWDTLWVENNTLVSSGQDFIGHQFHYIPQDQFIWINHNSIFWHDVWIKKSYNDQNFYFTNNLLHDISLFAQIYAWGQFFPDYRLGNTMLSLTCIDTLEVGGELETLPSDRRVFWEYNLQYNSPELLSLVRYVQHVDSIKTDSVPQLYFIPMLWDKDTPPEYATQPIVSPADSSRENRILNDSVNWPYMKYNHNWYQIDPQYNDSRIYAIDDSAGIYVKDWFRKLIFGDPTAPAVVDLPSYNWDIDNWNDVAPGDQPVTWPRFDGTYKNSQLLTASIEGLPLGDLNWYPDAKARWETEKDQIQEHILSLNEDKYSLTGKRSLKYNDNGLTVYPNPVHNTLYLKSKEMLSSVKVYDITGSLIKDINVKNKLSVKLNMSNLSKGIYIIKGETLSGHFYTIKITKK